jgi:hypothetical protein
MASYLDVLVLVDFLQILLNAILKIFQALPSKLTNFLIFQSSNHPALYYSNSSTKTELKLPL